MRLNFFMSFLLFPSFSKTDLQAGFRKGRGTKDQIANIRWLIEKQENSRKESTYVSLTTLKPLTEWITTNGGKFLKIWDYQTT